MKNTNWLQYQLLVQDQLGYVDIKNNDKNNLEVWVHHYVLDILIRLNLPIILEFSLQQKDDHGWNNPSWKTRELVSPYNNVPNSNTHLTWILCTLFSQYHLPLVPFSPIPHLFLSTMVWKISFFFDPLCRFMCLLEVTPPTLSLSHFISFALD